jgi:hypothetical protein
VQLLLKNQNIAGQSTQDALDEQVEEFLPSSMAIPLYQK